MNSYLAIRCEKKIKTRLESRLYCLNKGYPFNKRGVLKTQFTKYLLVKKEGYGTYGIYLSDKEGNTLISDQIKSFQFVNALGRLIPLKDRPKAEFSYALKQFGIKVTNKF